MTADRYKLAALAALLLDVCDGDKAHAARVWEQLWQLAPIGLISATEFQQALFDAGKEPRLQRLLDHVLRAYTPQEVFKQLSAIATTEAQNLKLDHPGPSLRWAALARRSLMAANTVAQHLRVIGHGHLRTFSE